MGCDQSAEQDDFEIRRQHGYPVETSSLSFWRPSGLPKTLKARHALGTEAWRARDDSNVRTLPKEPAPPSKSSKISPVAAWGGFVYETPRRP